MGTLPHDIAAERSVLGALLLDTDTLDQAIMSVDAFYDPKHRAIFAAIKAVADRQDPVDEITVGRELQQNESGNLRGYMAGLVDCTPTTVNFRHWMSIVQEAARRRYFIREMTTGLEGAWEDTSAPDSLIDTTINNLVTLSTGSEVTSTSSMADMVRDEFLDLEARREKGGQLVGVSTGFDDVDKLLSGLEPGSLYILAARPSMGKTAFAMDIIRHVSAAGEPVLFFSLEMSEQQVTQRLLSAEGKVDLGRLRLGHMTESEWPRFARACETIQKAPIKVTDKPAQSIDEVRATARRHRKELGLIVVDYLQLMRGKKTDGNREREVSEISQGLKALAKELKVPVLALTQLNRELERRPDKRPVLSDLRESGSIEQDADAVMFLYREQYYNPNCDDPAGAEVKISKNRNGSTGTASLRWSAAYTRFETLPKYRYQ